jgi:hypothetical protein
MQCLRLCDMYIIQQFTPLIVAALQGQMSAADALLDEGHADVKARNSRGISYCKQHYTILHSQLDVVPSRKHRMHYQYHTETVSSELLLMHMRASSNTVHITNNMFLPSTACYVAYHVYISYCCTTAT